MITYKWIDNEIKMAEKFINNPKLAEEIKYLVPLRKEKLQEFKHLKQVSQAWDELKSVLNEYPNDPIQNKNVVELMNLIYKEME